MPTDKLSVGLIGAGRIGTLHAEHLSHRIRRVELAMVTDIAEDAARRCAEACDGVRASADYREILGDAAIQAVVICSSTDTHAQIIEEAAAAGKHIFWDGSFSCPSW